MKNIKRIVVTVLMLFLVFGTVHAQRETARVQLMI